MRQNILMPIMIFMTRYFYSNNSLFRLISAFFKFFSPFRLILFTAVAFFAGSCADGPTKIGIGLLPATDFVSVQAIDTLSVRSFTVFDGAIRTDRPSIGYLGKIFDPYFGSATADFVTQLRLGSPWEQGSYTIDSAKLFLKLMNVVGSTTNPATLKLSQISEQIYVDSAYYSTKSISFLEPPVGVVLNMPLLQADTINDIELKLPLEFGKYLVEDTAMLFHSDTKPDFRSVFKGLYFQLFSGTEPLLASLYLEPPSTSNTAHEYSQNYFTVYMHDESDVKFEYNFIIDANNRNASFNRFIHDFDAADPDKKIKYMNDPVNGLSDTLSYLQYLNGVYTKIVIPGLESLKNDPAYDKIGVNKARLSIPVFLDGTVYKPSTVPAQLYLRYKSEDGTRYFVPDYGIDTYHAFFGGAIDSINNIYSFNLSTFVQSYLDDVTNEIKPEVELFQGSSVTSNVILKANKSKIPVRFDFTYTKF